VHECKIVHGNDVALLGGQGELAQCLAVVSIDTQPIEVKLTKPELPLSVPGIGSEFEVLTKNK
jgi:hypothetical protein